VGEYTGRRRGRAASEPPAQQPEYPHAEESSYQQGYLPGDAYGDQHYQDPYAQQPQPEAYGYEYGYAQPAQDQQGYGSYEQYPGYQQQPQQGYEEQQQGYYQAEYAEGYEQGYQEAYYQEGHQEQGYQQQGYQEQGYQEAPYYQYDQPYAEPYAEQYAEPYADQPHGEQYAPGYADEYAGPYTEQYAEPYAERYGEAYTDTDTDTDTDTGQYAEPYPEQYQGYPDDYADIYVSPEPLRAPLPPLSHLPYTGAATVALAIAAFVSTKAVAAVVLPLQLVVAWAVLDLAGFASRRTAVLAALPVLAGTVATFKFQADDAAVGVAAGLGGGFVLIAADAVFRARRRGVEPGSVRALAAATSALLFAGLTGLAVPAADLHLTSVAVGAGVCAFASLLAARNPDLGASRAAVVAIPVTIAALASYAAAILVP
jgi:hypothetical protein